MLTDSEIKALREGLDLPEDADAAAIQAKVTELAARPEKATEAKITDEAIAAHFGLAADKLKAVVDAAKEDKGDKVTLSKVAFEELQANAGLGAAARRQQLEEARDTTINAAVTAGKISRDRIKAWTDAWDKDPEGVKADLDSLEARFPVGDAPGDPGSEDVNANYTDDMAREDSQLFGLPQEAFAE